MFLDWMRKTRHDRVELLATALIALGGYVLLLAAHWALFLEPVTTGWVQLAIFYGNCVSVGVLAGVCSFTTVYLGARLWLWFRSE